MTVWLLFMSLEVIVYLKQYFAIMLMMWGNSGHAKTTRKQIAAVDANVLQLYKIVAATARAGKHSPAA